MIQAAGDLGFGADAYLRDVTQMRFVASLVRQGADRFILKGGMAMRALYGSTRLTKDVDFDSEDNVSDASMQRQIERGLAQAAREAGLAGVRIDQTKRADASNRWRLRGADANGVAATWEVEVSRRGVPPAAFIETRPFQLPRAYRIAPFAVRVYGPAAMCAAKVAALLSDNRNVPRDVYDLHELMQEGATPVELWVRGVPAEILQDKLALVVDKIDLIDFRQANAELLPYVAPAVRASLDEGRWDAMRIEVAERVETWLKDAQAQIQAGAARNDAEKLDLAGR